MVRIARDIEDALLIVAYQDAATDAAVGAGAARGIQGSGTHRRLNK
jgi:hypothetical protein